MTRIAIFDCDGTLVDGQASVCMAMEDAFAATGLAAPPREHVRRAVGLSLPQAMAMLLPGSSPGEQEALAERYRLAFQERRAAGHVEEPLFEGMDALLRSMRKAGWHLAVATGKSDRGLAYCLEEHGIGDLFDSLQTADRHPSKPDPSMIEQVLCDVGGDAAEAVMIGDTTFDIIMAANAGVRAVGVAWGYHQPDELIAAGASAVAENIAQLAAILTDGS